MAQLRVAVIQDETLTDGPGGPRTSVYFQGCTLGCQNCQSPGLWPFDGGQAWDPAALAADVAARGRPVTLIGGEPLQQDWTALALFTRVMRAHGVPHVILYTGLRWEDELVPQLDRSGGVSLRIALAEVDILVDGRFERLQDDAFVQWRGSRNQRPIDLKAMRDECVRITGDLVGWWRGEVVTQDWDRPRLMIQPDGSVVGSVGLIRLVEVGMGEESEATRRCGQVSPNLARPARNQE